MNDIKERSAYPSPEDFHVMRPEYVEQEDGGFMASVTIAPFRVTGTSVSKAGARRAALFEAEKAYRSYHPSYRLKIPYPDVFVDQQGVSWRRVPAGQRDELGDYVFIDENEEEDYADIETMLLWDVRPVQD